MFILKCMRKIISIIILSICLSLLFGCNFDNDSYASQYKQLEKYPGQSQELCEAGGAEWIDFPTGCHDECVYERWSAKDHYACTEAFSKGCDCGPDKCWNGNSCEPN